jgi:hypothetical protein
MGRGKAAAFVQRGKIAARSRPAAPALSEGRHCRLARHFIAVRGGVILTILNDEDCPHPRRSYRRGVGLENAADNFVVGEHVEIVVIPFPGGREAEARLRMR